MPATTTRAGRLLEVVRAAGRRGVAAVRRRPTGPLGEGEMVRALLAQGLDVAYQPVIEVATGQVIGWEALLRGSLPLHGALSPEHVVGSAARIGSLDRVMRQVAEQALMTATVASLRLDRRMTISVNLEPDQLRPGSPFLRWLCDRTANAPVRLLLEVTERTESPWSEQTADVAARLRGRGIGLAIDDLGAGPFRMRQLALEDWAWVKLDRGFLLYGERGLVLLRHTVAMLHELGATVLLEGIETAEQLDLARTLGVQLAQGNLLGAPSSAQELLAELPPGSAASRRRTAARPGATPPT